MSIYPHPWGATERHLPTTNPGRARLPGTRQRRGADPHSSDSVRSMIQDALQELHRQLRELNRLAASLREESQTLERAATSLVIARSDQAEARQKTGIWCGAIRHIDRLVQVTLQSIDTLNEQLNAARDVVAGEGMRPMSMELRASIERQTVHFERLVNQLSGDGPDYQFIVRMQRELQCAAQAGQGPAQGPGPGPRPGAGGAGAGMSAMAADQGAPQAIDSCARAYAASAESLARLFAQSTPINGDAHHRRYVFANWESVEFRAYNPTLTTSPASDLNVVAATLPGLLVGAVGMTLLPGVGAIVGMIVGLVSMAISALVAHQVRAYDQMNQVFSMRGFSSPTAAPYGEARYFQGIARSGNSYKPVHPGPATDLLRMPDMAMEADRYQWQPCSGPGNELRAQQPGPGMDIERMVAAMTDNLRALAASLHSATTSADSFARIVRDTTLMVQALGTDTASGAAPPRTAAEASMPRALLLRPSDAPAFE